MRFFKQIIAVLLCAAVLVTVGAGSAAALLIAGGDGFFYSYNEDGSLTLAEYRGRAENVEIPSELFGDKITVIAENAFINLDRIKSVNVPDSVTEIQRGAFFGCTALEELRIPASVVTIAPDAFEGVPASTVIYSEDGSPAAALLEGRETLVVTDKFPLGDADLSGVVDINDVTRIQKYCVDLETLSTQERYNADVNGDKNVTIRDATRIQMILVGIL